MALKIISGVLRPRASARHAGTVAIDLTNVNVGPTAQATIFDLAIIGSGAFIRRPCVIVALRRASVYVGDFQEPNTVDLNLDDSLIPSNANPQGLQVTWRALHGVSPGATRFLTGDAIREISFLVIGETADPVAASVRTTKAVRRKDSSKKSRPKKKVKSRKAKG